MRFDSIEIRGFNEACFEAWGCVKCGAYKQEKDAPMKNKFSQIVDFANKFDHRYIQFAYFAFLLVGFLVTRAPADGGGGPI